MKKIALLLALIFVLSAFAGCTDGTNSDANSSAEDNSSATSDDNSNGTSDDSSDDSDNSGDSSEDDYSDLFVYTGVPVVEKPNYTVISTGAPYTKSNDADINYPDTYGSELTDGIRSTVIDGHYQDEALSGYVSAVNVDVDLGKIYDKIYGFEVGYLSTSEAGISEPSSISVRASFDGKSWTNLGTLSKPESVDGSVMTAVRTESGYVQARYIRFQVSGRGWVFLDEINVIADIEASEKNKAYLDAVKDAYQTLGCVEKPKSDVAIDRELSKVLVSEGKKYTIAGDIKNFEDVGGMLTDGKVSGYYEGATWVGFDPSKDTVVTVNLGKTVNDIAVIEANVFVNTNINIFMPVAVKIAALDNKKNRTELGVLYGNTVISSGDFCFSLPLDNAISAQYIEYTFVSTESSVFMVEELGVYAYRTVEEKTLYPAVSIESGSSEWGSEGSSEYINLINGLEQQILTSEEPSAEYIKNNTTVNFKLLTNGKYANGTNIHNGSFFKFSYGGSRTVFYDLTHTSAVDKFTAGFVHLPEWAVSRPNKVTAHVSPDGDTWYNVGEIVLECQGDNPDDAIYRGTLELDKAVNVRYVAFAFDVGAWVGCDELEVFGKKNSSGKDPSAVGYKASNGFFSTSRIEPSDDILGGTKDLCLMYQTTDRFYTAEDLIPYLAYVDKDGKPVDVMFDNLLFLYNNTRFPSGGSPHTGSVKSDWEFTINDLYLDGRNVMSMEEAAGQVKTALGLPSNYKFKYTVTLYYPIKFDDSGKVIAYDFGDIDGDGKVENTGNYDDRVEILKWYIASIEKMNSDKNFENIELVGYYWWHEALENIDKDGIKLLNDVSDMVHETGKEFFWIPYFCANGYNLWADCGFDVACMQPNYVFNLTAPYSNVVKCAQLTQTFGLGFEVEVDSPVLTNELYYARYMQYLGTGATMGYMNDTINMYYQSISVFGDAALSDSTMARNVYDQTYHYIKGDLVYNPEVITGLNYTDATKNTPYTGKVEFENDVLRKYQIVSMPESGTVTLNGDGSFTYYPAKDFTGEVKFSFAYSEYFGWSEPCEVTITVK